MELPSSCFAFPYSFIVIFIIVHVAIFLLILKFIPNVEKLAFLWGMINWTIAIGVLFFGIMNLLPIDHNSLLHGFIGGIIPPITEDVGRLIVFTFIYKSKNHNFNNSLIFGAGHGGWESIGLISIDMIPLLMNFYAIKNAKDEEELKEKELIKTYELYKNGVTGGDIFGLFTRFLGNFFHMGASVIIYRFSLNRKEKKYMIFFIILVVSHLCTDLISETITAYELNMWISLVIVGISILIIVIGWFVWKENNNKEYSDYNFEGDDSKEVDLINIEKNELK